MARKSKEEEAKDGEAIDVAALSVGRVLKNYPLGQLVTLVATLLGSGAAGGYWVATLTNAAEVRQYKTEAEAQAKVAGTLQQAIAAGNCVKSRELMRQDAARAVVARLDLVTSALAYVKKYGTDPAKRPELIRIDMGLDQVFQVELLLEDPTARENINAVQMLVPRVNEAIKSMGYLSGEATRYDSDGKPLAERRSLKEIASANPVSDVVAVAKDALDTFDDTETVATAAREYLKAKYLSLDGALP